MQWTHRHRQPEAQRYRERLSHTDSNVQTLQWTGAGSRRVQRHSGRERDIHQHRDAVAGILTGQPKIQSRKKGKGPDIHRHRDAAVDTQTQAAQNRERLSHPDRPKRMKQSHEDTDANGNIAGDTDRKAEADGQQCRWQWCTHTQLLDKEEGEEGDEGEGERERDER